MNLLLDTCPKTSEKNEAWGGLPCRGRIPHSNPNYTWTRLVCVYVQHFFVIVLLIPSRKNSRNLLIVHWGGRGIISRKRMQSRAERCKTQELKKKNRIWEGLSRGFPSTQTRTTNNLQSMHQSTAAAATSAESFLTSRSLPSGLKVTQVAWHEVANGESSGLPPPRELPPLGEAVALPAAGCSFVGQNERAGGWLLHLLPLPLSVMGARACPTDKVLQPEK